jgi:4-amino-4-deoxy-L-arabinose transferase-like glycosyltransferase
MLQPPVWVWIALAIPTIGSVVFGVALVAAVSWRDWRWRRRQRRRERGRVLVLPTRPPADTQNGGVGNRSERATKRGEKR